MISYLLGKIVDIAKNNNRVVAIVEVNNIGYEVQIPSRLGRQLESDRPESVKIFTHLQVREDRQILYGFSTAAEKDLFLQLISVSGIGTQSAIALLDTLGLSDLVQAIVTGNIRLLTKTPGVGQKTAERIALELKTKLAQWRQEAGVTLPKSPNNPAPEIVEDLEMTLLAIGYSNEEIQQALSVLSQDNQLLKNPNVEEWIRRSIAWLSAE
jgi:holliday junction DNA helicase RuvA